MWNISCKCSLISISSLPFLPPPPCPPPFHPASVYPKLAWAFDPAFQVLGLLMWAAVPGWLHHASFQCQVRTVQAQGRVPTQPLNLLSSGMGYFTEPWLFRWWLHWHQKWGISVSASSWSPLSNHPQHQATPHPCPLSSSPTPTVPLPHWILLFWVVWRAPDSSVVDFNFTSWALFTNLGMGLLHKIKHTEEYRNRNLASTHKRKIFFWTDNSHI